MRVQLDGETDVHGFREHARELLAARVSPLDVHWTTNAHNDDLFANSDASGAQVAREAAPPTQRVPASFVALCETVALHSDPRRFDLLYKLLWRLAHEPALRSDPLDVEMLRAQHMAKSVRHDIHKMRAFVRFREVVDEFAPQGVTHVAWFEPSHHIIEANAPWFMRRFTNMHWAILTPERCVSWDGKALQFRPGAHREDAPPADAGEDLWLTYYRNIFNPARLKLAMMQKEMPRKYWRNLPEAQLISQLAMQAQERSGSMIEQPATIPTRRIVGISRECETAVEEVHSLHDLASLTQRCTRCTLGLHATQAVNGKGPIGPALMFVGEQPGDQEDLAGQAFVGPAGQLLDRAFQSAGIDRSKVFVTNAVRHFKFELRGKRRIHKTPTQAEAAACMSWLEEEISLVKPRALVALGATAARSLLGRQVAVTKERGQWLDRTDGSPVLITLHPSALLRMPTELQAKAFEDFVTDLQLARARA
ncbi:MAG: UdgX family uracil-DNA binding protein [Ramlibacter sp.]|nr:UdgX family uracil-DNA binding protein [Ramlibacter sp.]